MLVCIVLSTLLAYVELFLFCLHQQVATLWKILLQKISIKKIHESHFGALQFLRPWLFFFDRFFLKWHFFIFQDSSILGFSFSSFPNCMFTNDLCSKKFVSSFLIRLMSYALYRKQVLKRQKIPAKRDGYLPSFYVLIFHNKMLVLIFREFYQ